MKRIEEKHAKQLPPRKFTTKNFSAMMKDFDRENWNDGFRTVKLFDSEWSKCFPYRPYRCIGPDRISLDNIPAIDYTSRAYIMTYGGMEVIVWWAVDLEEK